MKITSLVSLVCLMILLGSGCQSSKKADQAVLDRAIAVAEQSAIDLTPRERELMRTQKPDISIYRISGDWAQYSFEWIIDGMRIMVWGEGDLKEMKEARVVKSKLPDPQ